MISSRHWPIFAFGIIMLIAARPLALAQAPTAILAGPYLQAVSGTSVVVLVETASETKVTVEYGPNERYGAKSETSNTAATKADPVTYVHRIKLGGLRPGTSYHYRVVIGESKTGDFAFTTAVSAGTSFRFAFAADFRTGVEIHDAIAAKIKEAKPLMAIYGGDLCYDNSYKAFKNEWFRPNQSALDATVPYFNAAGNHEGWSDNTKAFTLSPQSSSGTPDYYSFDYGDIHFICINNQVNYSPNSPQAKWVTSDLAATRKRWRIVFCHNPAYCVGGHGEDANMVAMSKALFAPNKVDMVLAGHSHFYQHNLVDGVHHMVVGSAGAPLYDPGTAAYTVKSLKSYCYALLDLDSPKNTLTYNAYDEKGNVLDTLSITKEMVLTGRVLDKAGKGTYNAVVATDAPGVDPVVTNSKGEYSISFPLWGGYTVYCDAPGYSGTFNKVDFAGPVTIKKDWTLASTKEAGVYNGSFEKATKTGSVDGWEIFFRKPPTANDVYGKPWPDKRDMYKLSLAKGDNSTPGGSLSAVLATNKPLDTPGIDYIDQPHWAGTWNGGYTAKATGVTDTTMTDTAAKFKPDFWSDGTWILQIVHGELPEGKVGNFRIVSNTTDTITVRSDSGMVAKGFAAGDATAVVHDIQRYWYPGGIRTAAKNRTPVDRSHVYNFYFKQKSTDSYTGREPDWQHRYALVWRDKSGKEIARSEWKWTPSPEKLSQSTPKMFVAPPVGAASVEVAFTSFPLDFSNRTWSDVSVIDDVVVDPVPVLSAAKAASAPDKTRVLLAGDTVTLAPRNTGGERSTDYFYVSDADGGSGIRVVNSKGIADDLRVNDALAVAGTISTDPTTKEKYIEADFRGTPTPTGGITPYKATADYVNQPKSIGRLVTLTGNRTSVMDSSSFVVVADGKATRVSVVGYPLPESFSSAGGPISVTGVVGGSAAGNVILMRNYSWQTTPPARNDITFFGTTDTHYSDGPPAGARVRIDAMNALPGTPYPDSVGGAVAEPRGVVFTGDLTNASQEIEWSRFTLDFGINGEGRLRFPVYELTGNHDAGNTEVGFGYPQEGIRWRNQYRPGIVNKSASGLNYSWDWDSVHFLAMNEDATPLVPDSLPFLKADLEKNVGTSGRPVVVLMHYGVANKDWFSTIWWTPGERQAFHESIKNYNVIAILHGHTYNSGWFDSYDHHATWGGIDVFFIDGYLWVFHIAKNEFIVNQRTNEGKWLETFRKPVKGLK